MRSKTRPVRYHESDATRIRQFQGAIEHIEECRAKRTRGAHENGYRQMRDVLEKLGVCEIPALGEVLTNLHQAMQMVEPADGAVSGAVAIVVQKGYTGDRVCVTAWLW